MGSWVQVCRVVFQIGFGCVSVCQINIAIVRVNFTVFLSVSDVFRVNIVVADIDIFL